MKKIVAFLCTSLLCISIFAQVDWGENLKWKEAFYLYAAGTNLTLNENQKMFLIKNDFYKDWQQFHEDEFEWEDHKTKDVKAIQDEINTFKNYKEKKYYAVTSAEFGKYDTVLHVAGIAHVDIARLTEDAKKEYYRVNCDLAVETAKKARQGGSRQFVYFSSVIVYGDGDKEIKRHITKETPLSSNNCYGDSKIRGEAGVKELLSDETDFCIAILRIPFVYGPGCRGNYNFLKRIAEIVPVFPDYPNSRSMIYVDNLAEFVRHLIDEGKGGVFFPQNMEYVSTAHMVQEIGRANGKKIWLWKGLNSLVTIALHCPGKPGRMAKKAFGSLTVDRSLSGLGGTEYDGQEEQEALQTQIGQYQVCDFAESVRRSIGR